MTVNEIIKAWEWHIAPVICNEMKTYPAVVECSRELAENTLDLINRQKTEIERLREIANPKCQKCVSRTIECAKSEAIKEFAHFVIDRSRNGVVYLSDIPDLVKEMTEVQK